MKTISIIVPFYKGNQYLPRLLSSINALALQAQQTIYIEVLIVNDSPDIDVILPEIQNLMFSLKVIANEKNSGIQKTRINGLQQCQGEWIVFLDQDDELIPEGFMESLDHLDKADVIVGNAIYEFGEKKVQYYRNKAVMKCALRKSVFLKIRNMIPSPGECIIRKDSVPEQWISTPLVKNGADDYYLWLLMWGENRKFICNERCVYIHHDANGGNLSLDYDKMMASNMEMCEYLKETHGYSEKEIKGLCKAIEFKYYQDTGKIKLTNILKYLDVILDNVLFKMRKHLSSWLDI